MTTVYKTPSEIDDFDITADLRRVLERHGRFKPILDFDLKIDLSIAYSDKDDAVKLHGAPALAKIKIIGPEDRARGNGDVRITVDGPKYERRNQRQRDAILCHELYRIAIKTHRVVEKDEADKDVVVTRADLDPYERPVVKLIPDDWHVTGFRQVAEWYGNDSAEVCSHRAIGELLGQLVMPFAMAPGSEDAMNQAKLDRIFDRPAPVAATPAPAPGQPTAPDAGKTLPDGGKPTIEVMREPLRLSGEEQAERKRAAERSREVREDLKTTPEPEPVNYEDRAMDLMLGLALNAIPIKAWEWLKTAGASDHRIRDELARCWGTPKDADTPWPSEGFSTRGGKVPAFWRGDDLASKGSNGRYRKPDLQGPALTARVRKVLRIPQLGEQAPTAKAPEPVYDLFLVYGSRGQKTPVYAVRAPSYVTALAFVKSQHPADWKGRVMPDDGTQARLKIPITSTVQAPVVDDQADDPEPEPQRAKASERGKDIPFGMSACSRCNVIRPRKVVVCPQCGDVEFMINPDEPDTKPAKRTRAKRQAAEPGEVVAR